MTINIFEGSRRIAILVALVWMLGWIIAAFNVSPSITIAYKISGPGVAPIRMTEECPSDSATEFMNKATKSGTNARIKLCFLARTADNGNRVIPFRVEAGTGRWWGDREYSTEVSEYTRLVKASFVLPQADETWIEGQRWPQFLKELGQGILFAIIGLLSFWAFTWITGWIVRGFLGIPRGKDRRDGSADIPHNP